MARKPAAGIDESLIAESNRKLLPEVRRDLEPVARRLGKRGVRLDALVKRVASLRVAIPSWAVGTGGTRFGRFPGPGEPRDVLEKIEDAAAVHRLTRANPTVSLHIPWDRPRDPAALKAFARERGLGFDAMNSNTFQDQKGQKLSYKFGSLCHADKAVRDQAVEHNVDVIRLGEKLGSSAITVWIADGGSYPGQMDFRRSFARTLESFARIRDALPKGWRMFLEHKAYEPAFYSTIVQDWGTSYVIASELGPKVQCLVDLGHHLPNCNIEMVVARLIERGKLGGFHFNDSKFGDDDLSTGSIKPYGLFLIFHELVKAADERLPGFRPAYMLDQSHNLKDPLEDLIQSTDQIQQAYAKALLVDQKALVGYQDKNDVLMAEMALKDAYETDVRAIVRMARLSAGGAIDPIACYRVSGYRKRAAEARPQERSTRSGIV